jgi:hypothetical protein
VQASNVGRGQIWTTDEVIAQELLSPNGFFQLDPASQWLKSMPCVMTGSRQKTQVNYSYTEIRDGQANGLAYTPYNSAVLKYQKLTDLPPGI